jgi:hypothetical protein
MELTVNHEALSLMYLTSLPGIPVFMLTRVVRRQTSPRENDQVGLQYP